LPKEGETTQKGKRILGGETFGGERAGNEGTKEILERPFFFDEGGFF